MATTTTTVSPIPSWPSWAFPRRSSSLLATSIAAVRQARRDLAGRILLEMKGLSAIAQSAMIQRLEDEWRMPSNVTPDECRPMTWQQLREMRSAGLEVGSHGVHHRMLAKLPVEDMEREVRESKATLDRELGKMPGLMSYPVGGDRAFNDRVVRATRDANFDLAVCYICGTNPNPASNRFSLYRLPVERMMGLGWFATMLTLPNLMSYQTVSREPVVQSEQASTP